MKKNLHGLFQIKSAIKQLKNIFKISLHYFSGLHLQPVHDVVLASAGVGRDQGALPASPALGHHLLEVAAGHSPVQPRPLRPRHRADQMVLG